MPLLLQSNVHLFVDLLNPVYAEEQAKPTRWVIFSLINLFFFFLICHSFLISYLNDLLEANYKSAATELLNASCHDLWTH